MKSTPTHSHTATCPRTGRPLPNPATQGWQTWCWPAAGLLALVWFLVRVLPRPSRAAYPCQRVAAPLAAGFVAHLLGLAATVVALRHARRRWHQARYLTAGLCGAAVLVAGAWATIHAPVAPAAASFTPSDPPNQPMGVARGFCPGRVTWVHDPAATSWDGSTGHWWDDANTNQAIVDQMLSDAIRWLAGAPNDATAWDRLFRSFNQTHGKGNVGYAAGEPIAIKINLNNSWSPADSDHEIDASPPAVRALRRPLVNPAGVAQADITVYDAIRYVPDHLFNPCHTEFPGVIFVDTQGGNGRTANEFVSDVLHFSNGAIPSSAANVARCAIDADYLVSLAIFKRHGWCAPLTVSGKNHLGSISGPGDLHPYIDAATLEAYDAQVDLLGHADLGGKTVLFLLDGLYGSRDVVSIGSPWGMAPFNDDWPSSLFASQDPVALDSVALDFMRTEMFYEMWPNADRYLHEGAHAANPPSGTFYDPENDGTRLASLGVHEHWNNAADRQYSRNLGTDLGIELVSADPGLLADLDNDGDVDLLDYAVLATCLAGPDVLTPSGGCTASQFQASDLDADADVDLGDFGAFQAVLP